MSQYQEQAQEAQLDFSTGGSSQSPAPSYNGTDAAMSAVLAQHCANSATQADIDDGVCPEGSLQKTDGTGGTEQQAVPQDLMVSNALMNSPNDVMTTQEQTAMPTFMALAFDPTPPGAMPAGAATTNEGKAQAYQDLVNAAQRSLALSTLSEISARQTAPGQSSNSQVQSANVSLTQWATGTMGQIVGAGPAPSGGYFPNGVSFDAWLMVRAEGWFLNPNWAGALNSYSEASALKDIAMINSYKAYVQYLQYRDGEQTNLLLAQDTVLLEKIANNIAPAGDGGSGK